MPKGVKLTTEIFIKQSQLVHSLEYSYEQAVYVNAKTKIEVICNKHGSFWQLPHNHLRGSICPKCNAEKTSNRLILTQNEWIKKAKNIHKNLFDYSLVEYKNSRSFVKIICKKHGVWEQYANSHLQGYGCQKCKYEVLPQNQILTNVEWINRANEIHGNKYDYSKVQYTGWS